MVNIKSKPPQQGVQAGLRTDILSPKFYNFLWTITDSVLVRQGGGGSFSQRLYDDLEQDAFTAGVIHKRKMAVIKSPWGLEPASVLMKHQKQAEFVYECLEDIGIDKLSYDLLDAIMKGHAIVEIVWKVVGDKVKPIESHARDARRFEFREDQDTGTPKILLKDWDNQFPGQEVADRKFMLHTWGAKDSNPHGLGLGNKLFWPVFFKKQAVALWQIFLEKFAMPTVKGDYDPATLDKNEQAKLLSSLQQITQDAALIVPKGTIVDLLEPNKQGSVSPFERALRWFDEQISVVVMGETLTTGASRGGSRAAAQVHDDIRIELSMLDMAMLNASVQKQLVQWIMDYNFPGEDAPIFYRKLDNTIDNKARGDQLVALSKVGFYPSPELILRLFGDGFVQGPVAGFQNTVVSAGAPQTDPNAGSDFKVEPVAPANAGSAPKVPPVAKVIKDKLPRKGSNSLGVMARSRG